MSDLGLQPKQTYWFSANGNQFREEPYGRIPVPNIVGYFYGVLRQYWDNHGLGKRCLLVSESKAVAATMRQYYQGVEFISVDLFSELMGCKSDDLPDWCWNVCESPPPEISTQQYHSIICQSLLEHVIDPTAALLNLVSLLAENGVLYLQTHTPSFMIHRYPRDYIRFTQDYFEDIPIYFTSKGINCKLIELYLKRGFIEVAIQRY